ncbi:MAG: EscU/YscU/HrcU family type III secretion system export apparatus switch protein [Chloroflexi bacterium]|nr:EscU/YscU/HrcU family type III secretion system export apparatus switch protein [Chloroflexota bacterium]
MSDLDKPLPPSAKKLEDARGEGNIARSNEINIAVSMLVGFWVLVPLLRNVLQGLASLVRDSFGNLALGTVNHFTSATLGDVAKHALGSAAPLGPFVLWMMVAGVAASLVQTRGLVQPPKVDFKRINPLTGLQRLLSGQSFSELAKAMLKVLVIGLISYWTIVPRMPQFLDLVHTGFTAAVALIFETLGVLAVRVALAYLLLAAADYGYRYKQWFDGLRMSRSEAKDEARRSEGDPKMKQRIRARQMALRRQRMLKRVATADVVIVNPVQVAVALQYDRSIAAAPIVVAKGARLVAERIVELAREHSVPVVQNIPLARTLYSTVEINHVVPADLYQAVAEVLAFVFSIKPRVHA